MIKTLGLGESFTTLANRVSFSDSFDSYLNDVKRRKNVFCYLRAQPFGIPTEGGQICVWYHGCKRMCALH